MALRSRKAVAGARPAKGPGQRSILVIPGPNLNLAGTQGYEYAVAYALMRLAG
jgi:hypothetical protein